MVKVILTIDHCADRPLQEQRSSQPPLPSKGLTDHCSAGEPEKSVRHHQMSMDRMIVHPYDESPLPATEREAFASLLSRIFDELPNSRKTWCASLALGLPRCIGLTVRDMASIARCTEAELLHGAVSFAAAIGIMASPNLRGAIKTHMVSGEITVAGDTPQPAPKACPPPGK